MKKLVYALLCMSLASCGGGSGSTPNNGGDNPPNPNPDTPTLKNEYVLSGDFGAIKTETLLATNKSLTATEFRPINFGNAPIGRDGFTYGNKIFVSLMAESYPIGFEEKIDTKLIASYSHDGVNWYKSSANLGDCQQSSSRYTGTTTCNTKLFFDPQNKQFIAANFKSRDGITWEAFNNQGIIPSTYENNIYLALNDGYLYRSTDAENWTRIDNLPQNSSLDYISNNLVNTSESFIYQSNSDCRTYYISNNGVNWESQPKPKLPNNYCGCNINSVNGHFTCSYEPYNSNPESIFISLDGMNWTPEKLILGQDISSVTIQSSKYLNNQYLAACKTSGNYDSNICSSADGINWSYLSTTPNFNSYWNNMGSGSMGSSGDSSLMNRMLWADNNYYYWDQNSLGTMALVTSVDLINWRSTLTQVVLNNYLIVNNKQFATLSCPDFGDEQECPSIWVLYPVINSFSALNWNPAYVVDETFYYGNTHHTMTYANAIASNGKKYVAASLGGLFYSSDGTNWFNYDLPSITTSTTFNTVKFINNQFIAVTNKGTVYRSSDGTTWDEQTISGKPLLTDVLYNNGTYILVGTKGYLARSNTSNKDSWDVVNTHSSDDIMSIVSNGNNTLVAVGEDGLILTSTNNGVSFTKDVKIKDPITGKTQVVSENINAILYNGLDGFIAVGNNGIILTSRDGINWNYYVNNPTQNYLNISPAK